MTRQGIPLCKLLNWGAANSPLRLQRARHDTSRIMKLFQQILQQLVHTDAKQGCGLACSREEGDPRQQSQYPSSPDPDLLADVLSGEDLPAGLALEAAQMPLLVQS